jgi:hypothetical protein
MPQFTYLGLTAAALLLWTGTASLEAQRQREASQEAAPAGRDAQGRLHEPASFAGVWDYNPEESINIQTGRPEQSPRSATQRGGPGVGGTAAGGSGRRGPLTTGIPDASGERRGGPGGTSGIGPTAMMQREMRDLARDLLEVAETLSIAVAPETVTITDDLSRERTYNTDGRKQEHQLGAARFDVRTTWQDGQLRREIEGGFDFKMTETYFLSPDGRRMFVIIRVGEARRDRPQTGFDRVYDRVDPNP